MNITRGNSAILKFQVLDYEGTVFTDLSSAFDIKFFLKENQKGTSLLVKNKTDMLIDDPETGFLKVPLNSTELTIEPGSYYIALKIYQSNDLENNQETIISETGKIEDQIKQINIVQNISDS